MAWHFWIMQTPDAYVFGLFVIENDPAPICRIVDCDLHFGIGVRRRANYIGREGAVILDRTEKVTPISLNEYGSGSDIDKDIRAIAIAGLASRPTSLKPGREHGQPGLWIWAYRR
jgi:hypothetical protein